MLLAVLFTSPIDAHASSKSRFQKYVQKTSYVTRLKNVASSYAMKDAESCDMRNTTFERKRYDVLEQPAFKSKSSHPTEGIWIEKVSVFVCGEASFLDVTVISDNKGRSPQFKVSESKPVEGVTHKVQKNFYGDYDF